MIWPFNTTPKEEPKAPLLEEIQFGVWRYTPQTDITPHEVALLIPMFINPLWRVDYQGYVDRNNLRRHFTKVEE